MSSPREVQEEEEEEEEESGNVGNVQKQTNENKDEEQVEVDVTAMQRSLRDLVFQRWLEGECEERSDTHKAVGAVDMFVPFFPLTRSAVARVIESHMRERASMRTSNGEMRTMTWQPDVVDFLVGEVEFEREYAIEGGKEAPAVLSRWVTRALRRLNAAEAERARLRAARAAAASG